MARILIVDDEPHLRATVGRALALEGHRSEAVVDGETALARLDGGGFHLAVVDLSLPGMDGLGLLQALRDRGDPLPVIILTAHGSVQRAVQALKLGAHDFLEKPPDRDHLIHAVAQALEVGRLREQVAALKQG
ncbi:MAG: response regulator [Acidobacteriota bacterium]